jgi:DNA (cytosine-5)-methyltransferase 1
MKLKLTLGSLFSGSGGFELGGLLCGIEPLWASEILLAWEQEEVMFLLL